MKFIEVRNVLIVGLEEYLGCPVILSEQISTVPDFPYCYYSVLSPRIADHSFGLHETSKTAAGAVHRRAEPVKASFSFTICSENREDGENYIFGEDEALELAEKALGYFLLKAHNTKTATGDIVVNKVGAISSRSSFHIEDTIRRYGFDVIISYVRIDEMETSTIESIGSPKGEAHL